MKVCPRVAALLVPICGCSAGPTEARVVELQAQVAELQNRDCNAEVQAELAELKREVEALRAGIGKGAKTTGQQAHADASVPPNTTFPVVINYELGDADFHEGDAITLEEVRGTSGDFSVGDYFIVRGTYTLQSRAEATLSLSVTGGSTTGNARGRLDVTQGTGRFELATRMPYDGYPHVTLRDGKPFGGVYFGKGQTVLRDKGFKYP